MYAKKIMRCASFSLLLYIYMTKLAFVYIVLVFWENVIHIEHIGTTSTVKSFHRLFLNNPILVTEAWINYPQNNSQQQYSWLHTQKVSFKKIFTYNAVRVCHSSDSSGLRGCGLIDITFRLLHRNMWRHLLCVPPPVGTGTHTDPKHTWPQCKWHSIQGD